MKDSIPKLVLRIPAPELSLLEIELVSEGKFHEAVQRCRERTGHGLMHSKSLVEEERDSQACIPSGC